MKLAAVILNYNNASECIEAVKRIENYPVIDAVIVVDNASSDDSRERIGSFFEMLNAKEKKYGQETSEDDNFHRFMLVNSEKNGGYGAGNNLGVRYAYEVLGAEYVIIANPDVSFSEECALRMTEALAEDEEAAVVSAVMKDDSGGSQQTAWMMRGWLSELLNSGPLSRRIFSSAINYSPEYFSGKEICEVGAVHGSLLCVDADKFMSCGGYDENIFLYCEENVLGFKMRAAGYKTLLLCNESYRHEGSTTIKQSFKGMTKRQRIRQRSERYYYRNYLKAGALKMIFTRIFQGVVLFETCIAQMLGKI